MAAEGALIPLCPSDALVDGARGVRFSVVFRGEMAPAFASGIEGRRWPT